MSDEKKIDDGGQAFPKTYAIGPNGMSLLDWFAGQVAQGICASQSMSDDLAKGPPEKHKRVPAIVASAAFLIADAMVAERAKRAS